MAKACTVGTRRPPSARAVALQLRGRLLLPDVGRLAPSGASLAIAFALAAMALAAYAVAWHTPLFAIQTIEVVGVEGVAAKRVRASLAELDGRSLPALRADDVERPTVALPEVRRVSYDRAFPHTLVVFVEPERAVAVLRRGAEAWLLSDRARAIRRLQPGDRRGLPRVWTTQVVPVSLGEVVSDSPVRRAVRALALPAARGVPGDVRTARVEFDNVTFVLRSGLELRLGSDKALGLKLAIARRILPRLDAAAKGPGGYLDVGVSGRPVAGIESHPKP